MLRDSVLYSALPLRTVAYASASAGGKVKIMAVVEPTERGVKLASAVFGLIDDRNQLVVQWTANTRELATLPLVAAGEAVPGPYRLRVAAVDTSGRSGSAEYDLVARLTEAGPLLLSTMAVGTSRDGGFIPKLVFGTDQAAVVFFETYGLPPKADSLTVRLELATSPEERALTTAIPRIVTASDDRRMVIGALPIAPLAPGDYTIRAIISLDGRPVGTSQPDTAKNRVGKLTADNSKLQTSNSKMNSRSSGFEILEFGVGSLELSPTLQRCESSSEDLAQQRPYDRHRQSPDQHSSEQAACGVRLRDSGDAQGPDRRQR